MNKPRVRTAHKIAVIAGSDNVLTDLGIEMSTADMFKLHIAMAINRTSPGIRRLTGAEAFRSQSATL